MIRLVKKRFYFSDRGIQQKTSELAVDIRELRRARNVSYYEKGSLTKRFGYDKRYTNPITGNRIITGLYEFIKRDGTSKFITASNLLYYGSQGTANPTAIGGGLTFTVGTEGQNFNTMITFNNQTIGTNGIEKVWAWNGTGNAANLAGDPPIAEIIAEFQNHIFLAGNDTYPYRLYFSNDGDETTWTVTDYIDIGDLTSPITGLMKLHGQLYLFTRKAFYALRGYDRDTFVVDLITEGTGCSSYKSIIAIENDIVFWSDRGPYSFNGITTRYLGGNIEILTADINYNRIQQIIGEVYKAKNQVWWAVSTGSNSNNNKVICMSYLPAALEGKTGISENDIAFSEYTGMSFNTFATERSTTTQDRLYAGNYSGYVFRQDQGNNDNGNGVDFSVLTPPINMDLPEEFKRFRYLWIFNKQQGNYNLSISYKTDFGLGGSTTTISLSVLGASTLWNTLVWGTDSWGGSSIVKSRVPLKAKGHHIEFEFNNSNTDQPIVIKGFTLMAQLKGAGRE